MAHGGFAASMQAGSGDWSSEEKGAQGAGNSRALAKKRMSMSVVDMPL